jgi:hypothetical protein
MRKKGCLNCGNTKCDIDVSKGIVEDGCLTWQPKNITQLKGERK